MFHNTDDVANETLNQKFAAATESPAPSAWVLLPLLSVPLWLHPKGSFTAILKAGEKNPKHKPPKTATIRPMLDSDRDDESCASCDEVNLNRSGLSALYPEMTQLGESSNTSDGSLSKSLRNTSDDDFCIPLHEV